jgi:hypothetical protein
VGRGPHTFEARATDRSGNVDPTPAKASFTIVLPPPVLGAAVNARLVSGSVSVAQRSGRKGLRFFVLKDPRQIAVGSFVNARPGTVRLISATDRGRRTQSGSFGGGLFQVLQSRKASAKGLTNLVLKGSSFKGCRRPSSARAQAAVFR